MPRYKKAESDQIKGEARQRLLSAALSEFATRGYAGANINRISEAAGFAQGTIYNYFPSKRALFEAVVGDIATRHCELVLQGAASATDPASRLERLLAAGFAFAQGFPAAAQLIVSSLYGADPEVRALVRHSYQRLLDYVEQEIVRAGLQERLFRPLDAKLAMAVVLTMYLGGYTPGEEGMQMRLNPRAVAGLLLDGLRGKD